MAIGGCNSKENSTKLSTQGHSHKNDFPKTTYGIVENSTIDASCVPSIKIKNGEIENHADHDLNIGEGRISRRVDVDRSLYPMRPNYKPVPTDTTSLFFKLKVGDAMYTAQYEDEVKEYVKNQLSIQIFPLILDSNCNVITGQKIHNNYKEQIYSNIRDNGEVVSTFQGQWETPHQVNLIAYRIKLYWGNELSHHLIQYSPKTFQMTLEYYRDDIRFTSPGLKDKLVAMPNLQFNVRTTSAESSGSFYDKEFTLNGMPENHLASDNGELLGYAIEDISFLAHNRSSIEVDHEDVDGFWMFSELSIGEIQHPIRAGSNKAMALPPSGWQNDRTRCCEHALSIGVISFCSFPEDESYCRPKYCEDRHDDRERGWIAYNRYPGAVENGETLIWPLACFQYTSDEVVKTRGTSTDRCIAEDVSKDSTNCPNNVCAHRGCCGTLNEIECICGESTVPAGHSCIINN